MTIEGDLEAHHAADLKTRLEEPWTVREVEDIADQHLEGIEEAFESRRFHSALEITRTWGTYYKYIVALRRNDRLGNGMDMDATIRKIYKHYALAFILTTFKTQNYSAVCNLYQSLRLAHRLNSFERGWVSCCAAVADLDKTLQVMGGQAELTLESAIEIVDNDKDLVILLHWLNDEIWSDDLLAGHPSGVECRRLREGYNVWLSIEDEKAAAGSSGAAKANGSSIPWLLATG